MIRVIGIDPGFGTRSSCAVSAVDFEGPRVVGASVSTFLRHSKRTREENLAVLARTIRERCNGHTVGICVEDQCRVAVGAQGRGEWGASNLGVILVQGLVHGLGLPVVELQPQAIKKAVTGAANATKEQVARCVLLRLSAGARDVKWSDHETDSLAAAIAGRPRLETMARRAG